MDDAVPQNERTLEEHEAALKAAEAALEAVTPDPDATMTPEIEREIVRVIHALTILRADVRARPSNRWACRP